MRKDITTGEADRLTRVLDHAGEFVDRVATEAPAEYRRLMAEDFMRQLLGEDNAFNQGKLYTWAEYRVFRSEFRARFPDASRGACINAFCKLFMKNDISISNLVDYFESDRGQERRLLEGSGQDRGKK